MKISLYASLKIKPETTRAFLKPQYGKASGMVLIIVLCCVALLTILIVGFLSSASTEVTASKQFSSSAEAQNLASSALNLVMGQVAEATTGMESGAESNTLTQRLSWASQPGMIRTYTTHGNGSLGVFYKLYSSSMMRVGGDNFITSLQAGKEAPPQDWDASPATYTDLNAPFVSGSTLRFPIVDPRADQQISGTSGVAGFSYEVTEINGTVRPQASSAALARLPMPVQWLYVLKDGRFVSPGSTGPGSTVMVNGATKANPIVGRIAFWTDDDSCKVNINTAAEGNFWDTPMAHLTQEGPLNLFTPAGGEYQRYMGHPATTSLSAVFPWLKGTTPGQQDTAFTTLAPRVVSGGSTEGTVWYTGLASLAVDTDRLYDSVDEFAFNAQLDSSNRRVLRAASSPAINLSPSDIERRRFFLTAQSRSPEVTLFNTPRVAVWPLHSTLSARHAAEKLIALAASTGTNGKQYYFTRATPFDPMADFNDLTRLNPATATGRNAELLGYLQKEMTMPIPGYDNKTFSGKWGVADRDQILIEIYDYIRSCINLRTTVLNGGINTSGISYSRTVNGTGEVYPTILPAGTALGPGKMLSTNTRGFGRFPSVREVAVQFACQADPHLIIPGTSNWNFLPRIDTATQTLASLPGWDPSLAANDISTPAKAAESAANLAKAPKPAKLWPALLIEMFLPAQGLKQWFPNLKVTATGLNSFSWIITQRTAQPDGTYTFAQNSIPMFSSNTKVFNAVSTQVNGLAQVTTGYTGVSMLYSDTIYGNPADPSGPTVDNWSPDFLFSGGTVNITLDLGVPDSATQTVAGSAAVMPASMRQEYSITFPPMTKRLPNPRMAWQVTFGGAGQTANGTTTYETMAKRMSIGNVAIGFIDSYAYQYSYDAGYTGSPSGWAPQYPDIIKSMVVKHGDYRLISTATELIKGGVSSNPDNIFIPHADYFTGVTDGATVAANPGCYARPAAAPVAPPADYNYYCAHNLRWNPKQIVYPQLSQTVGDNSQRIGKYVIGTTPLAYSYMGWGGGPDAGPSISPGISAANSLGRQGDWDSGIGDGPDGPFINKVDEGTDRQNTGTADTALLDYLQDAVWDYTQTPIERTFGPMRQIASPVMFGSLSTAVKRYRPWETLLFCPNPAASYSGNSGTLGGFTSLQHSGFESPPDHLLLDLFWMPVTEPYAISDSFSTAGKINLNYQIIPFTYINRSTAMRAVLANQKLTALDESKIPTPGYNYLCYKAAWNMLGGLVQAGLYPSTSRWDIDATATLSQFDTKFDTGEIFRSATEICEMFLVPQGFSLDSVKDTLAGFWTTRRLTGDNMRERPYNSIYPRVTTRSNVYTVYVKAQAVKQTKSTLDASPDTFTEGKDRVESEFQASYTFERYLDPNAPASVNDTDILGPYKMRVINQRNLSW